MLPESCFASDRIQQRIVKLPNGEEHPLHFRELPAVEFRKFLFAEQSDDEERRAASMAHLIAASLCEADGKPCLTVKQALKLNAAAANAIAAAVLAVNGVGEKKA